MNEFFFTLEQERKRSGRTTATLMWVVKSILIVPSCLQFPGYLIVVVSRFILRLL